MHITMRRNILLFSALLVTATLYWSGLSGPFLFDDDPILSVVHAWAVDQAPWQRVVFGHQSLLLARPVAMATFLLNASLGGSDVFYYKLGNLIFHLICGWLIWFVCRRALAEDARLVARADLTAALIATLWLLHPLHVSTVLYAVQRMAQLSALFTLAAVWVYLIARKQLASGQLRRPLGLLFVFFPVLVTAGLLSKQNAAVAPALCLVLEIAYFSKQPRSRYVLPAFYCTFLLAPLLILTGLLLAQPDVLLLGYGDYDFSLGDRLLSQPRALASYLTQILLPRGPLMGLYTDDFVASTSLLSPASTLPSLLLLVFISTSALRLRKQAPSLFAGWFFFLVAHSVESGALPLDLYFEHRNYLPAVGLLLAAAGLLAWASSMLKSSKMIPSHLGMVTVGAFAAAFAFATMGRVLVWQQKQTIVEQGLRYHPDSLRANLDRLSLAQSFARDDMYSEVVNRLTHSANAEHRAIGHLYQASYFCARGMSGGSVSLAEAVRNTGNRLTLNEENAFRALLTNKISRNCGEVTEASIGDAVVEALQAASQQSDHSRSKWALRFLAAEAYARAGLWEKAQAQAELAWQPNADAGVGTFLAQILAHNGLRDDAIATLREVARRIGVGDGEGRASLNRLENKFTGQPVE